MINLSALRSRLRHVAQSSYSDGKQGVSITLLIYKCLFMLRARLGFAHSVDQRAVRFFLDRWHALGNILYTSRNGTALGLEGDLPRIVQASIESARETFQKKTFVLAEVRSAHESKTIHEM